jgi:hypothetical protein
MFLIESVFAWNHTFRNKEDFIIISP